MSDPVSNAEIEDVLSSIRRLVSEECRSKPREAASAALSLEDRLVLTPALRVAEPEDQAKTLDTSVERFARQDPEMAPSRASDAVDTELSDGSAGIPEPSNGRDDSAEDVDRFQIDPSEVAETIEVEGTEDRASEDGSAQSDDVEGSNAAPSMADDEGTPEVLSDIDSDEIVEGAGQNEEVEPEDPERPVPERDFGHADDAGFPQRFAADPRVESPPEVEESQRINAPTEQKAHANSDRDLPLPPLGREANGSGAKAAFGQPQPKPSLGVKAAILEAAIGKTRDQWEPDDIGTDDYSGTKVRKMDWADDEGGQNSRQRGDAHAPMSNDRLSNEDEPDLPLKLDSTMADLAEEQVNLPATMETVLDEDSLRELVAEIVRQELQGPLGERITRNVRKLVRREIHRALSLQDLE